MNDNDILDKIKRQVEYYLSDENLKNDNFFNTLIINSGDGFIPIQTFLNCNKIKKMGISIDKLQKGIKLSSLLKLSEDSSKVKRLDPITPKLRKKKLLLTLDKKGYQGIKDEDLVVFVPFVITFAVTPDIYFKARDFERKIQKAFLIETPYVKISKKIGVVVLNEMEIDVQAINEFLEKDISVEKVDIKMTNLGQYETDKWFKNNRPYLESALRTRFDYSLYRDQGLDKKPEIDENYGPLTIGTREFKDFREAKNYFKSIVAKTRDGEKLETSDANIVKELLNHHTRKEEKMDNIDSIAVDINPIYPTTRCFFIQDKEGNRNDFSYHKCLQNLYIELAKHKE